MNNILLSDTSIGSTIRSLRIWKDISQGEFAEIMEISSASLSMIEAGKRGTTLKKLQKITNHLNLNFFAFLYLCMEKERNKLKLEESLELMKIKEIINEDLKAFISSLS